MTRGWRWAALPAGPASGGQAASQQLGQVHGRAGRPGGRAGCGRRTRRPGTTRAAARPADAGSRCVLGHRHRHLVVAALHAEVAGQAAAAAEPGRPSRRPRRAAPGRRPSPSPRVVAVRLGDHLDARPGRAAPRPGRGGASSSARVRVAPATRRPAGRRQQLGQVSAQHRGTGRLQPDDRHPASASGPSAATVRPSRCAAAPSSWPVVIQVSPQQAARPGRCTW